MLGCFAKDVEECPLLPPPTQTSPNRAFLTIDSEFEALQRPSSTLDHTSIVFSASEIFRLLRDMALGVTPNQSKSLLTLPAPSNRAERSLKKLSSGYLVHPGAVLCMLDLLPCLEYDLILEQNSSGEDRSRTPSRGKSVTEEENEVLLDGDCGREEEEEEHKMTDQQAREVQLCTVFSVYLRTY